MKNIGRVLDRAIYNHWVSEVPPLTCQNPEVGKIAKSFNDEFTKIEINFAVSPNSTSSSNQFKNRLKKLRDNFESNELSRQTIADF